LQQKCPLDRGHFCFFIRKAYSNKNDFVGSGVRFSDASMLRGKISCLRRWFVPENRANTGGTGKKIPTDEGWDFGYWWRRGELNPRPPMLRLRFYMLSLVFGFHPQLPNRHGSLEPIPLGFSSIGEGRASALFGKSRRLIPEYRHCRVKRSPEFRRRGRSWSRSQLAFLQTV